jgi:hypothetical protein
MPQVVFFTIHSTTPWWTYLGSQLDFADAKILSDLRGDGDWSLVDDFYRFMRKGDAAAAARSRFGEEGCADITCRCRTLRSLDPSLAMRMIGAMAQAIERAFDALEPDLVVTFTMDRYVMDVMDRIARARGIDFLEMTTSIIPNEVLFMRRGRLIQLWEPDDTHIESATAALSSADFAPTYARGAKRFGAARFWHTFGYFALRGAYFNALRHIVRDPLNCHYLDALKRLKHKVRIADVAVLNLLDTQWRDKMAAVPRERRAFLGLQLFPEASLDYWLRDPAMVQHDDAVVRYCEVLGAAGYRILIKDHPLQFGFRQRQLMQRLAKLPFVVLLPYDIPATFLLGQCGVSVTFTGTIGFQAALAGICSVVTEPYYAADRHYVHVRDFAEIDTLVERISRWRAPEDLDSARRDIVRHLARGSVPGDYFMWRRFDPNDAQARAATQSLVQSFNTYLPRFMRPHNSPGDR